MRQTPAGPGEGETPPSHGEGGDEEEGGCRRGTASGWRKVPEKGRHREIQKGQFWQAQGTLCSPQPGRPVPRHEGQLKGIPISLLFFCQDVFPDNNTEIAFWNVNVLGPTGVMFPSLGTVDTWPGYVTVWDKGGMPCVL